MQNTHFVAGTNAPFNFQNSGQPMIQSQIPPLAQVNIQSTYPQVYPQVYPQAYNPNLQTYPPVTQQAYIQPTYNVQPLPVQVPAQNFTLPLPLQAPMGPVLTGIPPLTNVQLQPTTIQLPLHLQGQVNPFGLPTNIPTIAPNVSIPNVDVPPPALPTLTETPSIDYAAQRRNLEFQAGDEIEYDFDTGEMRTVSKDYAYSENYGGPDVHTRVYTGMQHQKLKIEPGRPVLLDAQTKLKLKDQIQNHILYPIRCGTCTRVINSQGQNVDKALLELANSSATEYPENIIGMIMDKERLFNSCCRAKIFEAYMTKNSFVDPLSYANLPGQGDAFSRFSRFTLLPEEALNIRTIEGAKDDFSTVLALPEGKAPSDIPLLGRDVKYEDIKSHIEYNNRQRPDMGNIMALPPSFNINDAIPPSSMPGLPATGTIALPNNMIPGLSNMALPPVGQQLVSSSIGGQQLVPLPAGSSMGLNTLTNSSRPDIQGLQLAPLMPISNEQTSGPGLPTLQRLRTMPTNLVTVRAKRVRVYKLTDDNSINEKRKG